MELGGLVERDVLREARDLALEGRELERAAAGDNGVDCSLSILVSKLMRKRPKIRSLTLANDLAFTPNRPPDAVNAPRTNATSSK